MQTNNYFNELRLVVEQNLNVGVNDTALNSIVNEALERLPEIRGSIPFGIDEEQYVKEELAKVAYNIIMAIKREVPFGIDEVQYINMIRKTPNLTTDFSVTMPFGVDETAYLEKMRNSTSVDTPFGMEEMVENIVESMTNLPEEQDIVIK